MSDKQPITRWPVLLLVIAVICLSLLRFVNLDADPGVFKNIDDIADEGYWAHEPRALVLFDKWQTDDFNQTSAAAPLYGSMTLLSYRLFDVSLFSTRLVSAFFGVVTILFLYLAVRNYDKKVALYSALTLAICDVFFMYTRIGHVESQVLAFLMISFYFLTLRNRDIWKWVVGGLFFVLALMTKMTAIYYFPAFIIFFLVLLASKKVNWKHAVAFCLGAGIPGVLYLLLYYLPNRGQFSDIMSALSGVIPAIMYPPHIIQFFSGNYFSYPAIFLLTLALLVLVSRYRVISGLGQVKELVKEMDELLVFVVSWFVGIGIGVILSDFVTRRFTLLIIPLVIVGGLVLSGTVVRQEKTREEKSFKSFLPSLLISVALGNFLYYPLYCFAAAINLKSLLLTLDISKISGFVSGMESDTVNRLTSLYLCLGVFVLSVFILFVLRKNRKVVAFVSQQSDLLFFSLCSGALVWNFIYRNYVLLSQLGTILPGLGLAVLAVGAFALLVFAAIRHQSLPRLLVLLSLAVSVVIFVPNIFKPTYSVRDASVDMAQYCDGEWVIGPVAHELALNNQTMPLHWMANANSFKNVINEDAVERYHPGCMLLETYSITGPDLFWPSKNQVAGDLTYRATYDLYPAAGNRARYTVDLYTINYSGTQDEQ